MVAHGLIHSSPPQDDSKSGESPKEEGFLKSVWHKLTGNKCSEDESPSDQNKKESSEKKSDEEQKKNDDEQKKSSSGSG